MEELDPAFTDWVARSEHRRSLRAGALMGLMFLTGLLVGVVVAGAIYG